MKKAGASTRRFTLPYTTSHQQRHCLLPPGSVLIPQLPFQAPIILLLLLVTGSGTSNSPHLSLVGTVSATSAPSSDGPSSAPGTGCLTQKFTPNIVASKEDADLKVLVPNITSLRQFVNCSDPARVRGFSIDVFEAALSVLSTAPDRPSIGPNMSIHYSCFNFPSSPGGNGSTYDDMINFVANGTYDAVVGDVTLGAHRSSLVDFTHKYMESGIVVLTRVASKDTSPWTLFASPFSWRMWCTVVGAFASIGLLVCYLESDDHPEFVQGPAHRRIGNVLWFMIEALVLLEKEYLRSNMARGLMLAWLFFAILVGASYTAGLSSFLTVNNLSPSTRDILYLKGTGQKIGYRRGSIVKDILNKTFHIREEQLVPIRMEQDFINNLTRGPKHGGVVGIVDEVPYANILLSTLSSFTCEFGISGPQLTHQGFGFGFNKQRNLQELFSIALMNLTEMGCLQQIQDGDHMNGTNKCPTDITTPSSNKIGWRSSISLFIALVASLLLCIFLHYTVMYRANRPHLGDDSSIYIGSVSMVPRRHSEVDSVVE